MCWQAVCDGASQVFWEEKTYITHTLLDPMHMSLDYAQKLRAPYEAEGCGGHIYEVLRRILLFIGTVVFGVIGLALLLPGMILKAAQMSLWALGRKISSCCCSPPTTAVKTTAVTGSLFANQSLPAPPSKQRSATTTGSGFRTTSYGFTTPTSTATATTTIPVSTSSSSSSSSSISAPSKKWPGQDADDSKRGGGLGLNGIYDGLPRTEYKRPKSESPKSESKRGDDGAESSDVLAERRRKVGIAHLDPV